VCTTQCFSFGGPPWQTKLATPLHIHITSQTFTISNIPSGFMSGLIRSCITCVTRTGEALLNGLTSYGRDIRHIFFKPKVLCSCSRRSIIQCSMRNQCNSLFTCIMDYLHIPCMILMILSLCNMYASHSVYLRVLLTIYMYKFSRCQCRCFSRFFFLFTDFQQKIARFLTKFVRKLSRRFSGKIVDLSD
jgi:hypothetical protein